MTTPGTLVAARDFKQPAETFVFVDITKASTAHREKPKMTKKTTDYILGERIAAIGQVLLRRKFDFPLLINYAANEFQNPDKAKPCVFVDEEEVCGLWALGSLVALILEQRGRKVVLDGVYCNSFDEGTELAMAQLE